MAGPFHHDVRGDAEGEGVDDEGAAASMGADEFPLRLDLVSADVALLGGDTDLFIDTGELAQFLDVAVHRLVGVVREGLVVLEGGVLVFLQNISGNLVQLDGDAVSRPEVVLNMRKDDIEYLPVCLIQKICHPEEGYHFPFIGFCACVGGELHADKDSNFSDYLEKPSLICYLCDAAGAISRLTVIIPYYGKEN